MASSSHFSFSVSLLKGIIETLQNLYHCKIQAKFDIGNHPPHFGWAMALFRLSFCWCVDIGFHSINFCRDALILLKVCRRLHHCKIQVKYDISNHPHNFGCYGPFSTSFLLVCCYWFSLNNVCRDALILLKVCRRIYHCKMQFTFEIGNHPQNFGQVMALFWLSFCCWCKIQGKDIVSPQ